MKTIIAGTRDFDDIGLMHWVLSGLPWTITTALCGKAKGADALGEQWAQAYNIPVIGFEADWNRHGKAAGPIRNESMLMGAEALVAFWDGTSRGTEHMIRIAQAKSARQKQEGRGSLTIVVHVYKRHVDGGPMRGELPKSATPYVNTRVPVLVRPRVLTAREYTEDEPPF